MICIAAFGGDLRPNVILVMADDMGYGDPSYVSDEIDHVDSGWIRTPHLDDMAASGLRFDRFYSASAVCSPTRASCLTGRNPFRVGVPSANRGHLGRDETPLPEVLSSVGYRCGHFGKWHLGTMTTLRRDSNRGDVGNTEEYSAPWHHGYDTCFATEAKVPTYHPYRDDRNDAVLPDSFEHADFYGTRYYRMPTDTNTWDDLTGEGDIVPVSEINNIEDGDDSKLVMDNALDFIRSSVSEEKPFLAVIWFHTPHAPLMDPKGVEGKDSPTALKAALEDMDIQVGRLRDELLALGVKDNTMLWFTSDNGPTKTGTPNDSSVKDGAGYTLRTGGYRGIKQSISEGGVRVPGLLEWPAKIKSARRTDFPAVTSDYYPTILDYLQIPLPESQKAYDGISLRGLIEETETVRTRPIGFLYQEDASWVTQQYKLITQDNGSSYQLYDLLADPYELTDIMASKPEVASTMQTELNDFEAAVAADSVYPADPAQTDSDFDGLKDAVETGTGSFVSLLNTGTDPALADTDGDEYDDFSEITLYLTDPNISNDYPVVSARGATMELSPSVSVVVGSNGTVDDPKMDEASELWDDAGNFFIRERDLGNSNPQRQGRLYLQFDLAGIPSNATISAASIRVHQYSKLNSKTDTSSDIELAPVLQAWSNSAGAFPLYEVSVGTTTRLGNNAQFGTDEYSSGFFGGTEGVDITSLVSEWVENPSENHGLRIAFADDTVVGAAFSELDDLSTATLDESLKLIIETQQENSDDDDDDLPDWWEIKYFGDLTSSDGSGNLDGDSFTDHMEQIAGSNPKVADPRIVHFGISNQTATVRWDSVPGRNYQLLVSTNLSTWVPAFHALPGHGGELSIETPVSTLSGHEFYRYQVERNNP